jgi:hypothetical protein
MEQQRGVGAGQHGVVAGPRLTKPITQEVLVRVDERQVLDRAPEGAQGSRHHAGLSRPHRRCARLSHHRRRYKVPALVDSPTSGVLSYGRPGNGDGSVCGVPLGNRTTSFGGQIYNFIDDTLPAG